MNCPYCNNYLPPGVTTCPSCNGSVPDNAPRAVFPGQPPQPAPSVPNHLVGAILATLFCCLPFGIVSICYSTSVDKKLAAGDVAGAKAASDKAKTWMIVTIVVGAITNLLWAFVMFGAALEEAGM